MFGKVSIENLDDDYASKMGKSAVAFIPDGAFDYPLIKELQQYLIQYLE
ncbi:hypothetical protein [Lachnobacterium bovis]|nr:hypothetical protein [Lachnobacterium bovis]